MKTPKCIKSVLYIYITIHPVFHALVQNTFIDQTFLIKFLKNYLYSFYPLLPSVPYMTR